MNSTYFRFKKLFVAYTLGIAPFCLLSAILSLCNIVPVNFNNEPQYGIKGFILTLLFIPFIGLMLSVTNWLFLNLGIFIQNISLKILNKNKNETI